MCVALCGRTKGRWNFFPCRREWRMGEAAYGGCCAAPCHIARLLPLLCVSCPAAAALRCAIAHFCLIARWGLIMNLPEPVRFLFLDHRSSRAATLVIVGLPSFSPPCPGVKNVPRVPGTCALTPLALPDHVVGRRERFVYRHRVYRRCPANSYGMEQYLVRGQVATVRRPRGLCLVWSSLNVALGWLPHTADCCAVPGHAAYARSALLCCVVQCRLTALLALLCEWRFPHGNFEGLRSLTLLPVGRLGLKVVRTCSTRGHVWGLPSQTPRC